MTTRPLERPSSRAKASLRSVAGPPNLRYLQRLLAESPEQPNGGQSERGDEIRRDAQAGQSRMGSGRGPWTDVVEGVRRVKSKDGPDLIVWGSSTLTPVLLERELADEVLLLVIPVLLGTGKRFFSEGTPPRELALVSTKAASSGVIISTLQAQRAFADRLLRITLRREPRFAVGNKGLSPNSRERDTDQGQFEHFHIQTATK